MGHAHVRVPPDSTGKRMHARAFVDFLYEDATHDFVIGDVITMNTSGIVVTVSAIAVTSPTTGQIHATVSAAAAETEPVAEEDLYHNGSKMAKCAGLATKYYDQAVIMTGRDVDSWVEVDKYGSMFTRYSGGSPYFSAAGEAVQTSVHVQNTYLFTYSDLPDLIEPKETAGGTVTYNGATRGVDLALTAASGDKAEMRTNNYHKNVYGASRFVKMAVVASDAGRTNAKRQFGYYDDSDGVFIGHNGTQWYVGYRSSMSGSPVDYIVLQEDWNIDRLDGTGGVANRTGTDLDLSKVNLFSIDINWMNAGDIRFGGLIGGPDGSSSFASFHIMHLHNFNQLSFMRTGSLPLSWETSNTGVSDGSSWLRCHTAVVSSAGESAHEFEPFSAYTTAITVSSSTDYTVIGSMRAAQTFKSKRNTKRTIPQILDVYTTVPILIEVVKNQTLADETWQEVNEESGIEISLDGTVIDTGRVLMSMLVPSHERLDLTPVFGSSKELIIRKCFNDLPADEYTVQARLLTAGSATVYASMSWNELR